MKALAELVELNPQESLSRFEYRLPLAEALVRAGSARNDPCGKQLDELARSFSNDILNLAALAGRLLWYEGVTPERWRSYDLVSASLDVEAYFVMLQTACDIMASVIALLATKKNQAPSDSFHALNEWARRNPERLLPQFRIVAKRMSWFNEINGVRTQLVHRGKRVWVSTDRRRFQWTIRGSQTSNQDGHLKSPKRFLLTDLRRLTQLMLNFSEKLAAIVNTGTRKTISKKLVLSGVSVPALAHLLRLYKPPSNSEILLFNARCLLACGAYVPASYLGYPDRYWWRLVIRMCEYFGLAPEFLMVPVNIDGRVNNCSFVYSDSTELYGILAFEHFATDEYGSNDDWVREVLRSIGELQRKTNVRRVAVAARTGKRMDFFPETPFPVVVDNNAHSAARRLFFAVRERDWDNVSRS